MSDAQLPPPGGHQPPPTPGYQPPPPGGGYVPPQQMPPAQSAPGPKKSKAPLLVGLLVLAALVAGGVYFLTKDDGDGGGGGNAVASCKAVSKHLELLPDASDRLNELDPDDEADLKKIKSILVEVVDDSLLPTVESLKSPVAAVKNDKDASDDARAEAETYLERLDEVPGKARQYNKDINAAADGSELIALLNEGPYGGQEHYLALDKGEFDNLADALRDIDPACDTAVDDLNESGD